MECAWVWSEADMHWILVPSLTRSGSLRIYMLSLSLTFLNDPLWTIIVICPIHYVCHLCASRCTWHAPLPMELPDTRITSLCPCGSGGLPFVFCYCDYDGSIGSKGLVNWGAGPVGWFLHSRHFLFPYSLTLIHPLGCMLIPEYLVRTSSHVLTHRHRAPQISFLLSLLLGSGCFSFRLLMGWIVSIQNSNVETLTLSTSECHYFGK